MLVSRLLDTGPQGSIGNVKSKNQFLVLSGKCTVSGFAHIHFHKLIAWEYICMYFPLLMLSYTKLLEEQILS